MMSLPTLVIGTKNLSSWSLRPWLALKHLGVAFEELELPLDTPEYYERIGRYSPTGRVPVLIDGQTKVWDSLAICEYANELQQGSGFPTDRSARAHARSICAEMHSGFGGLRSLWTMKAGEVGIRVPPNDEVRKDIERIENIWSECRTRYGANGPWLFGNYSIADAMYAPVVLRFNTYGATLSEIAKDYVRATLSDPHVNAWITSAKSKLK
jgi:glutathione S-transferase